MKMNQRQHDLYNVLTQALTEDQRRRNGLTCNQRVSFNIADILTVLAMISGEVITLASNDIEAMQNAAFFDNAVLDRVYQIQNPVRRAA